MGMAMVGFGDVVNVEALRVLVGHLRLTSWARRFQLNLVQLRAFC